ncbi:MAG: ABC transporter permease [Gemmataceae bacterium]|nr:ABC transporter permease [Gemmataceae bacterium]
MKALLLILFKWLAILVGGGVLLVVAVILLISAGLMVLMLLQAVGLVRRVPLGYNVRNLMVRWRTTLLTGLAFTLVVALMTVMLAFVNGMYALTKGSAVAGNVMVLADGATDEVFSDLGYGDISTLENKEYIKRAEVRQDNKTEVRPLVSWELYQVVAQQLPNPQPGKRSSRFVQVRGIEDPVVAGMVHELPLHEGGQWFDRGAGIQAVPGGGNEQYVQGVLGEGLARELGRDVAKPSLAVGDTFELGPRKWVVVGIMKSAGKTFDSEVWAKREVVGAMLRKMTRSTAVIRVADGLDPAQVAREITSDFKSPAVQAQTETQYFESLNGTNQTFLIAIIFVTVFMGVGGVFGVMNTMFAAIAQRTRDIGVMRILGFARWQILVSFFLESLLLALIGGLVGCALGSLADGLSATSQMSGGQGGGKSVMLKLVVDARILMVGLVFSVLMGCVGGLLPALSAIRLKPLDAMH